MSLYMLQGRYTKEAMSSIITNQEDRTAAAAAACDAASAASAAYAASNEDYQAELNKPKETNQ